MLLALAGGLAVGLLMGALGGGGAILAIPLLVYGFDFTPAQATLASLVVVGIGAITGVTTHARSLDWPRGLLFGALGLAGATLGRYLSYGLDGTLLILAFSALVLVVASLMTRKALQTPAPRPTGQDAPAPPTGVRQGLALVGAATGVGFLTGFFGVGGGFAIVPALILILGLPMGVAVGTSLLVILINSVAALTLGAGALPSLNWAVLTPLLGAVVAGTLAGTWVGRRLPVRVMQLAFAAFLYLIAVYMGVSSLLAWAAQT